MLKNIHDEINSVNFIFKKACLIFHSQNLHTNVLYLHLMLYIFSHDKTKYTPNYLKYLERVIFVYYEKNI